MGGIDFFLSLQRFLVIWFHSTVFIFFFFNDPATPEFSPLPLHDALPICSAWTTRRSPGPRTPTRAACTNSPADWSRHSSPVRVAAARRCTTGRPRRAGSALERGRTDRKSTRLNSSHGYISYAVFCLKKKN